MKKNSILLILICCLCLGGCVNQYQEQESSTITDTQLMLEITDTVEQAAVKLAKAKTEAIEGTPRIVSTSPATVQICEKLNLDLVGVCTSSSFDIPDRYKEVTSIGTAMSPDMEILMSLNPDWILSPSSLQTDLQPKYEEINTEWAFLNLQSVAGMYRSIQELGEIFNRSEEAAELIQEFIEFYEAYRAKNADKKAPKVLILMGLPGSYIIATENSYVGSLVEMAGGENVYAGTNQEFLTVNTEDMKTKEPDIILRTAHALPEQVLSMFKEDFETNDIWKHFKAVSENKVYDLSYELFGMSANFQYQEALADLQSILYPIEQEEK